MILAANDSSPEGQPGTMLAQDSGMSHEERISVSRCEDVMKRLPVRFRSRFSRFATLATLFSACLLWGGCSGDKTPVLEGDSEAVIALKKAGAEVTRVPMIGLPNMTGRAVDLTDVKIDAEIMGYLAEVQDMTKLTLTGAAVTDDTLAQFGEWRHLYELHLSGSSVTGAGLKHLASLKALDALRINDTKVTGTGLTEVPPRVMTLQLNKLPIGDDDLKNLKHLKRLQALMLADTKVTAAGVVAFKKDRPPMMIMGVKLN